MIKKFLMTFLFLLSCTIIFNFTNVYALIEHGEGNECFSFDMDYNGFPVSSVTIDGYGWDKEDDYRYYSSQNVHTIIIKAGKKGDSFPWISTAGGLDDYKTYTAIENAEDDPNVVGDEYLLTLVLNNMPYNGVCSGLGISLQDGPFPVRPVIPTEADINITISGDELEYHYVASKPNEADVTYFKFGINSGISDDIVPFTFGNANYTHNDNEPPKNVSSVTTKQPIHYEYNYDGSGYVTFYVNGGATDEYTKIEINGVDYSDQAPHNQIEYFEHLMGFALIFEIHNVPYADTYDVVVEGRQTALENRVGGISWSYLNRERSGLSNNEQEGNFAHGRLEFVAARYTDIDGVVHEFNSVQQYNNTKFHGTGEIYAWYDGVKEYPEIDRRQAWGSSQVPYGTELTLRIVPDPGYQLVGLAKSPTGFTATDEVGVYKVVLNAENFLYGNESFDLQPVFAKVNNEVKPDSVNVKSGNININAGFENGTAKLEVKDGTSMSEERRDSFENTATDEGYGIDYYLDISLYNSIYKGGKKDGNNNYLSWDTEVEELNNPATITLNLDQSLDGDKAVVIHEVHSGDTITGYEVIDATYNANNKTLTFEAYSFSTYAVASKGLIKPIVTISENANTLTTNWENQIGVKYEVYRSENKKKWTKVATVTSNSYTNTGLTYGKTYYYKVRACSDGICTTYSNIVSKKVVPNKVENLVVVGVGSTSIKVSYDKVSVTGYEVYYGTSTSKMSKATTITKSDTLTYNKTNLKANTTYYFKVRAYKLVGKTKVYGAWSEVLKAITGPAVSKLTVSNKNYKSLSIKMTSVTSGSNYKLEVSTDNKNFSLLNEFSDELTFVHDDLTPGLTYYYRVKVCNKDEICGSYSSVTSKKVVPLSPVITLNKDTENKLLIKVNEQEGVDGYHIYRSTNKTKNYKKVGTIEGETEYLDKGLTYGTTYYYKVIAFNSGSTSSYSNVVSGKTVPNKVENLVVSGVSTNNITINYDKVNVTGYEIYYGTSTKKMSKATVITKSDTLTYNKTKLKANTTYYFKVRAYKTASGRKIYGPWSDIVSTKTAPLKPSLGLSMKAYEEVNINIGKVSGATNYIVERSLDGVTYELLENLPSPGVLANAGLETGKSYYYRVKACNGELCSPWVNGYIVSSTVTPGFSLKTSNKKVEITVNSVVGATGYEIYIATKQKGKYTKVKTLLTEDEVLSYINSTKKGKYYYYKVRAFITLEDKTVYSSYSGIKKIRSK